MKIKFRVYSLFFSNFCIYSRLGSFRGRERRKSTETKFTCFCCALLWIHSSFDQSTATCDEIYHQQETEKRYEVLALICRINVRDLRMKTMERARRWNERLGREAYACERATFARENPHAFRASRLACSRFLRFEVPSTNYKEKADCFAVYKTTETDKNADVDFLILRQ